MDYNVLINDLEKKLGISLSDVKLNSYDEVYIQSNSESFNKICIELHNRLQSPVMMFFAADEIKRFNKYELYCVFQGIRYKKWFFVKLDIPAETPVFNSLSKEIFSTNLFEREIKEMFGIEPSGSPDTRRLRLHDEVWPQNYYPLKKDFVPPSSFVAASNEYQFKKISGEGIFEVPVGPVHAGIIGPGHFRFSSAGEPVINLEIRLGFTHRGVEKIFEGKEINEACAFSECVSGDSVFAHGLSFCRAVEKAGSVSVPENACYVRAICLELERMYNHVSDIGGIAVDVGFSFPSNFASVIKESILSLNETLTGSRYLKGVNKPGGVIIDINSDKKNLLLDFLKNVIKDFAELKGMLFESVSFMDRVDTTGVLSRKIAEDLGVTGLAGRASGIRKDLRKDFNDVYNKVNFTAAKESDGDAFARLKIRISEFEESVRLINEFASLIKNDGVYCCDEFKPVNSFSLGYAEGWRGPILYWVKFDEAGLISRCKIVDPSFNNWLGLAYALPGNIIPDFPLCNKSFNLSYSGNDL